MVGWQFHCYDDGTATNLWQRWYEEFPQAQGRHDSTLRFLKQLERHQWAGANFKKLKGPSNVYEIRISGDVQHRIFGFFKSNLDFIVLACGFHKDRNYTPKGVIETAARRRLEVQQNPKLAKPCDVPR